MGLRWELIICCSDDIQLSWPMGATKSEKQGLYWTFVKDPDFPLKKFTTVPIMKMECALPKKVINRCAWHWGLTRSVANLAALHRIKLANLRGSHHMLHIDADAFQTNMI